MRVGIVGTGEMGRPLVDRMVAAGFAVSAYARRPEARAELETAQVTCVDGLAELAAGTDVVIVYVYSDDQVCEVVDGLAGSMGPNALLVVHTTGSPRTAETIDARLRGRGVGVIDAPASGGPAQVAEGTLTLFLGGDARHVERCRPLFAAYAAEVVHFGPVGTGQKVKLLNNLLFGAHVELAVEAARLSRAFGIEPTELATALHTCSGTSRALDLIATMGSAENLVHAAARYVYKDVLEAARAAAELDAPLGSIAAVTTPLLQRIRPYADA
jgi:3-hydroxyisobutyrate dehydrogenase-like beta-hydroxyacid dehydrogenase